MDGEAKRGNKGGRWIDVGSRHRWGRVLGGGGAKGGVKGVEG